MLLRLVALKLIVSIRSDQRIKAPFKERFRRNAYEVEWAVMASAAGICTGFGITVLCAAFIIVVEGETSWIAIWLAVGSMCGFGLAVLMYRYFRALYREHRDSIG